MKVSDQFASTISISDFKDLNLDTDSILFRASSIEARSEYSGLREEGEDYLSYNLVSANFDNMSLDIKGTIHTFNLRSSTGLNQARTLMSEKKVFIDITGFDHSHWAWLVRAALSSNATKVIALYCEPDSYKLANVITGSSSFDLSEGTQGIRPLPGFVRLSPVKNEDSIFVPMLGFEGPRLKHIVETLQPDRSMTFPIVGVPGFQLDFPFHAVRGNSNVLFGENIWANRIYARANCPTSAYFALEELRIKYPNCVFKVAPIGTKPHALGAILFRLVYGNSVDIIYDFPNRKAGRTKGMRNIVSYDLTLFKNLTQHD